MKALTKIGITSIIGFIACMLVYIFVINPALARITILNKEITDKKQESMILEQQIKAYQVAKADLAKAIEQELIATSIVNKEDLVRAILNMESAIEATNTTHSLKINEYIPNPKVKAPDPVTQGRRGVDEVAYRLSTTNTYTNFVDLLKYLEHLPQFTEVSKVIISAELDEDSTADVPVHTGRIFGSTDAVFFVRGSNTPAATSPTATKTNEE